MSFNVIVENPFSSVYLFSNGSLLATRACPLNLISKETLPLSNLSQPTFMPVLLFLKL